jgi:hypothetical protein
MDLHLQLRPRECSITVQPPAEGMDICALVKTATFVRLVS